MKINWLLILLAGCLCMGSCKTTRLQSPEEKYSDKFSIPVSSLNIPINLGIADLEKMLNQQLEGVLYEDSSFDDGDRLMIKAEKREDIDLELSSQDIRYRVPIALDITYNLGLANVRSDAVIALNMQTQFGIQPDWSLNTTTSVLNYEWLEKPRIKLGAISIKVASIADFFLRRSREVIGQGIDQAIQNNLDLRKQVSAAWKNLQEPIEASEEYQAWLLIHPEQMSMTPIRVDVDTLQTIISVESRPEVLFGSKPQVSDTLTLPGFQYSIHQDRDFQIYVQTTLAFEEADRLAKEQVLGESFSQGKRSVTIDDIHLYGQGERLVIDLTLSGSYNGKVYLAGYPRYNPRREAIDIDKLEFTLNTKNFLHKSAAWLLKGTIKKKLREQIDLVLDANLSDIRNQLAEQLSAYEPSPGLKLSGKLDELELQNVYLTVDGIKVAVGLSGKMALELEALKF